jgi:hypothetical protein
MPAAIVKYNPRPETDQLARMPKPQPKADFDSFVLAMFLLWAKAPRTPDPDADGFYSLGDVGEAPEKTWTKATPYSLARPK